MMNGGWVSGRRGFEKEKPLPLLAEGSFFRGNVRMGDATAALLYIPRSVVFAPSAALECRAPCALLALPLPRIPAPRSSVPRDDDAPAPRTAEVRRATGETDVTVRLGLDPEGPPEHECATGVGFFDHMLDALARHGGFALEVRCNGDRDRTGPHHTIEDTGIALGQALDEALGEKEYVARYGDAHVPMDEALARAVVDLSGRVHFSCEADFARECVGDFATEMAPHFWHSLAEHARLTLHLDLLKGENAHHQVEALFKAGARALREAVARDVGRDRVPSTKETF